MQQPIDHTLTASPPSLTNTSSSHKDVIIVGAGITGIALALYLQRLSLNVLIIEKADQPQITGNALWLYPNALAILDDLDVLDNVKAIGQYKTQMTYTNADMSRRLSIPMDDFPKRYGYPIISLMRQELRDILQRKLPDGLTPCFGTHVLSYEQKSDHTAVHVQHEERELTLTASLVVAADGMFSKSRLTIEPQSQPRYLKQTCVIGTTDMQLPNSMVTDTFEVMGVKKRFQFSQHGSLVGFCGIISAKEPYGRHRFIDKPQLQEAFSSFSPLVQNIIKDSDPESLMTLDFFEVPNLATWHKGRIGIIGDAAHGMSPNFGQGAAQGLEDAWSLYHGIARYGLNDPLIFTRLFAHRQKHVRKVRDVSRTLGRIGGCHSPILAHLRDTMLPYIPNRTKGLPDRVYRLRPLPSEKLTFAFANEEFTDRAADLLASEFAAHEPLSLALAITKEEIKPLFRHILQKSIQKKMALIAHNGKQVRSVMILRDLDDSYIDDPATLCPKAASIFAFLAALEKMDQSRPEGKSLEIQLAATDARFANQGIVSKMSLFLGKTIIKRGYRHAFACLTNTRSQHAFQRGIGKERCRLSCADYIYEGQKPFAQVKDPEAVVFGHIEIKGTALIKQYYKKLGSRQQKP